MPAVRDRPLAGRVPFLAAAAAFFLLAGCDLGDSVMAPPPGGGGGGGGFPIEQPIRTNVVQVLDNRFEPGYISVEPGSIVTWEWMGQGLHNIQFIEIDLPGTDLRTSGSHQVQMPSQEGRIIEYFCEEHGTANTGMRGRIVIQTR